METLAIYILGGLGILCVSVLMVAFTILFVIGIVAMVEPRILDWIHKKIEEGIK